MAGAKRKADAAGVRLVTKAELTAIKSRCGGKVGHGLLLCGGRAWARFLVDVAKPYKFIGFGAMDVAKPYKFIRFGAIDVTKPYKFTGFGAMEE